MSDFGQRLKEVRKQKGFTQKDLSKRLGVAQSTIANYETNERFPGEAALKEIADCLKVSVDYLLGMSELIQPAVPVADYTPSDNDGPVSEEALHLFNLLSEKSPAEIIAYAKDLAQRLSPVALMHEVYQPVMKIVGDGWRAGQIDISKEHYISGVMEQLITLSAQNAVSSNQKPFKVALLVPGAEEHLIPLRMAAEIFRLKHWQVYYLGRSLPVTSLNHLIAEQDIDLVAISITLSTHLNSAEYLLQALRMTPRQRPLKILVSGQAVADTQDVHRLLQADYHVGNLEILDGLIDSIEADITQLKTSR